MFKFLSLLLLVTLTLPAQDEIVVHLDTSSTLEPIHFVSFEASSSGFDKSHVQELEKALTFDLNHNGKTKVTQKEASFEVNGTIKEKKLSLFVESKNKKKGIEGIALSGSLADDRRKIHEVSDLILEALFNEKGIASTHILYTLRRRLSDKATDWQTEVYEIDYDGFNARQITHEAKLCVTPAYIHDEDQFVYVSYRTGQPKLYLGSLIGETSKRVTLMKGNQLMPTVSQKKDLLAFVSDVLGNPEIFVQKFDPKKGVLDKPWQVTSLMSGAQGSPTFSPDAKRLAFVSNKDGAARIYVTNVPAPGASTKEIGLKLISKQNRENTCPAWSPNGNKIAYSSKTKGVRQIWIYDFKTGKETQLTDGQGDKENPSWAPNSKHVVYHVSTASSSELYWIHIDQKESFLLTKGSGEKRFPSWGK